MSLYEVMKRDHLHNVNTEKVLVVESGGKFYCVDDIVVEAGDLKFKHSDISPAYEKTFKRAFVEVKEPRPLAELVAEWSEKNE